MSDKKPPSMRVGVWIRVSTPDQAQGESPAHHLIRGKQYAEMNQWTVVETYDLAGISGKTVWEQPECQRMLRDVKRGHIQGIIFSKLARLARNTRELLDFSEYFQEHNAHLISLEEKFDTSTPAGRLFFTFIGAIASWEREETGSRLRASINVRAKLGKPLGGKSPYGFKWQNQKLVQVPEEILVRRLAFELFLEHHRKGVVARLLHAKGHRTREGLKFRDMSIRRMLECTSAIGQYRTNQWRAIKGGRELKNEDEWGTVECEPVITVETFRRVKEILERQIKPERKPAKKPVHLFAGVLRCGCGGKMYVYTRSPNYTCQKCKNKIGIEAAENVFLESFKDEFTNAGHVSTHMEAARRKISERETELSGMHKKMEQIKAEMQKVYELYIAGAVTVEGFKKIHGPLEERLSQLTAEQPRIEGEITAMQVNTVSADVVARETRGLVELWPTLSADDKHRFVRLYCSKIMIPTDPQKAIKVSFAGPGQRIGSPDAPFRDTSDGWDEDEEPGEDSPGGVEKIPPPRPPLPTSAAPSGGDDTPVRIAPPSAPAPTPNRIFDFLSRLISHPHLVVERSDTTGTRSLTNPCIPEGCQRIRVSCARTVCHPFGRDGSGILQPGMSLRSIPG